MVPTFNLDQPSVNNDKCFLYMLFYSIVYIALFSFVYIIASHIILTDNVQAS